jgi:A/G-specific adenine glycosylase
MIENKTVHEAFEFSNQLIRWYHRHHRDLPWRSTTDPYKIWLSEIILQQTRVVQGMPYYLRFVEAYPTVEALAQADEQEVLRLWQGLGYYSRARNLHQTARMVVERYKGKFPDTYNELLTLKGIGEYTAAAIASFAFGEVVPAIDGNVYRVLARLFGVKTDIAGSTARKEFTALARQLIPPDDPATFNQAMIEFGAIQCQPVSPDCLICPFNTFCFAFENGAQALLPVKGKKTKVRDRYLNYIVLERNGKLAMKQRVGKDVWQGLYDFYLIETPTNPKGKEELPADAFVEAWANSNRLIPPEKTYVHILSHQKLHVRFWQVTMSSESAVQLPDSLTFYTPTEIEALPKPILVDTFIKEYFFC